MKEYTSAGKAILQAFHDHGYEAFFVGGYVRDFLLGIPSGDIDIATSATPDQVAALFPKTKNTGLKFGTVTVFLDRYAFEVTTFRTDGFYRDNRHPVDVKYAKTKAEDLIRRDFTINALAMDQDGKIEDLCGGIADLNQQMIRAIGDPDRRFQEDALRILRAFRFVAKLNFSIEEATYRSIQRNRDLLYHISNERIMQELKMILSYPHASKAFQLMVETGVADLFPDLSSGLRFLATQTEIKLDHFQFYALCFYQSNREIADSWRFSNKEREIIQKLIDLLTVTENDVYNAVLVYAYGLDLCLRANEIHRLVDPNSDAERLIRQIDQTLPIRKTCDLVFKGQDILQLTAIKDARLIGEVISDLVLQVITLQLPNEYSALKEYALKKLRLWETEEAE
jgi:tRNA nucleotidyltransferase (CCA-adding enzyme)